MPGVSGTANYGEVDKVMSYSTVSGVLILFFQYYNSETSFGLRVSGWSHLRMTEYGTSCNHYEGLLK